MQPASGLVVLADDCLTDDCQIVLADYCIVCYGE